MIGFKCLKCFSDIYVRYKHIGEYNGRIKPSDSPDIKRSDLCQCGNCGLILDLDGIIHLYCDDISTIVQCEIDFDTNDIDCITPLDCNVQGDFTSFLFYDYKPIKDSTYTFVPDCTHPVNKPKPKESVVSQAFKKRNSRNKTKGIK